MNAKAIVNLVDLACIMSRPSDEEINKLREENPDLAYRPNIVIDVYKNRRGRWTQIRIWGCNDLGTCRRQEVFVTDIKNMPLENFKLIDFNFNSKIDEEELEEYYNDGVMPTSDSDIDTLVKTGKLEKVGGFKKKNGDLFEAGVKYSKKDGLSFDFPEYSGDQKKTYSKKSYRGRRAK